jgi:predicted membrane-bound spermidine synthase
VRHRPALFTAFVVSGVAGLVYEVLWSRYLALFIGHGALAQVLVLAVYLGGMAVGALAVSDLSRRLARPLMGYAALEVVLGLFGLIFHSAYTGISGLAYDVVFPALGDPSLVGAVRWGIAGLLVMPQAIALGATFPLMAAGLVRLDPDRPGGAVARAYLLNTLGGAAGILLAGFVLIGWLGFAGTSMAAASLNFAAAGLVWWAVRDAPATEPSTPAPRTSIPDRAGPVADRPAMGPGRLGRMLLPVAFGTALASFAYEIGWIRMLSLLLGSATHAFELMLSAFILGLAAGAWVVRRRADDAPAPLLTLGRVQLAMGLAALASVPVYAASFEVVAALVNGTQDARGGYLLFNLGRYALALSVMLPATVLAGMTLPLLTASLLRAGAGERSIGRVYAVNTLGAVVGSIVAGLVALPVLGLKGLLIAGAALDASLGLWLVATASVKRLVVPLVLCAVAFPAVGWGVEFNRLVMTGGVFRDAFIPEEGSRTLLYYQDGRTATVSAHVAVPEGVTVLSTNGKPDASVGPLWRIERRDTLPPSPIPSGSDFSTQMLMGLLGIAHQPDAARVANVGHGSGITGATLLTHAGIERLVTIEIEPLMVEASLAFLPTNAPVFQDPRSSYVFDDAKSFFSYSRERFGLIVTEPSNPWVSGTSSLFTREFYDQIRRFLTDDGVLVQWMQLYELDDDLLLTVFAALDTAFDSYRVYLVGDADIAIVASPRGPLRDPDWSVAASPAMRSFTLGLPEIQPEHMESLLLFDERVLRPLLALELPTNSDFHPILDLGAERARFHREFAAGAYSFAASPFDFARLTAEEARPPTPYAMPPARGPLSLVRAERGAWLRGAVEAGGASPPDGFEEWAESLIHLQTFLLLSSGDVQLGAWDTWGEGFSRAAGDLHWGTTGWSDSTFFRAARDFLERAGAPDEARAVVDLHDAVAQFDWARAARAADILLGPVSEGARWMPAASLLDAAVVAYLATDRPSAARNALRLLEPRTDRPPGHLRTRVLEAWIRRAGG